MHDNLDRRFGCRGIIARLGWLYLTVALGLFLATAGVARAEVVNINKADARTLQQHLRDIGPTRSQAIVDYRKKHGPFKTIDDLAKVPGMGPKLVDKNRRSVSTKKGVYKTDAKPTAQRGAAAGSKTKATTAKPAAKPSGAAKQHDKKAKTASPKDKGTKKTKKDAKAGTTKAKKTSTTKKKAGTADKNKTAKQADKKTAKKKSDNKKKNTDKNKQSSKKASKSTA